MQRRALRAAADAERSVRQWQEDLAPDLGYMARLPQIGPTRMPEIWTGIEAKPITFAGRPCAPEPALSSHFYALAGDWDRMYACLDEALTQGRTGGLWLKAHPDWDPYRDDPRFQALIRRRGLAAD